MDIAALRNELTTDPAGLGYAPLLDAGSANQVAAALNEPRYPTDGPITIERLLRWAAKYAVLPRLQVAAQSDNIALAGIAQVGLLLTQNPNIPEIDLGLEDVQQMFAALVEAEVISAAQRDELFASGVHLVSRADVLGLGYVSADDISRAVVEG
jgi:hypothetical protein